MKIAIVKLSALGDIVHSMIVLQYIKQFLPNSSIDWFCEEVFSQVLENNNHINKIIPLNLKKLKKNFSFKLLKNQINILKDRSMYDVVIDMQGLLKSAIVSKLIPSKTIIGFDENSIREKIASKFYDKKVFIEYSQNVIKRNMVLIFEGLLNQKFEDRYILEKESFLFFKNNLSLDFNDFTLFIVGASTQNKIYPKEKFLELSKLIDNNIYICWGNDQEEEIANYLQQNSSNIKKLPKVDLDTLKFIISKSNFVIGADTGPTHMAWAMNIPSITIFGNTPAYRNTYETSINKTISSNSDVNPLKLDKSDFSINEIKSKDIYNIMKEV
jgi:heptosyltransferase-1